MRPDIDIPLKTTRVMTGGREWQIAAVTDADSLLRDVRTEADLQAFPYGLLLWPSALALADQLAEDPALARGKSVLELGAGVGLPGMAAHWLGGNVTQTDYQESPLRVAQENAACNGLTGISYLQADWRDFPALPPFDLVMGADLLYESGLHESLLMLLPCLLKPGGTLLLADPLRPQSAVFLDRLTQDGWKCVMAVRTIAWQEAHPEIALFAARRGNEGKAEAP